MSVILAHCNKIITTNCCIQQNIWYNIYRFYLLHISM